MNQTSPMNSGAAAGAAAILAPLIAWLVAKLNLDMPPAAQASLGVLLVAGAHWLGNFLSGWLAARKGPTPAPAAPAAPSGVAGRSLLSFLSFVIFCGLAVAAALAMSGCTTTTGAMYRGYMTEAEAGIKTWDDNAIATTRAVMCAQPYSAIQRHPEIQAMVAAGCGPIANTSTLDANQLQLLMNLMNASGVKLQAAPVGSK